MKCSTINKLHNCGKCTFNYNNASILEKTSCEQICKAVSSMLFYHKYDINNIDMGYCYNVKISCTGNITIVPNVDNEQPNISTVIDVYNTILFTWYTAYNTGNNTNNIYLGNRVLHYLCSIEKTCSINKIRQYSIQLVKEIEAVDNTKYQDISSIQVNDLSFNNLRTISKLSYIGILTLVYNILEKIENLQSDSLFISLRKCSFTSKGMIILSDETEQCESTILTTKILYSKYLNTWCKNNFTKVYDITKLKKSIDRVNKCKNISDIAGSCSDLLQEIQHTKY